MKPSPIAVVSCEVRSRRRRGPRTRETNIGRTTVRNRVTAVTTAQISVLHAFCFFSITLIAGLGADVAIANSISYSNTINPPTIVNDGDADDLDPDPLEIQVEFDLADPNGDWTAEGVIFATTGNPTGATLVVTDTQIRNVTGNYVLGAMIVVEHFFDPLVSFTQTYVAHIDGAFDKIGGGLLGNMILNDSAFLNGAVLIDAFNFAIGAGLMAPQTFDDTSLPLHLDTVNRQTERFIFYIDELDNVINLFDSASILPSTPVGVESRTWSQVKAMFE